MASAAVYQYSPIQKFGNGMISGSFVTKNKGPMRFILRGVALPMGVQNYDSKWSALVSVGDNPMGELDDVYKDVCQYLGAPFKIASPVRDVGYGNQIKVKFDDNSFFFDKTATPSSIDFFKKKCKVDMLVEVGMVWFKKGQEGGITLKALQVKMLENQDHEERQTHDSAVCSI